MTHPLPSNAALFREYQAGATLRSLAQKYKMTKTIIQRHLLFVSGYRELAKKRQGNHVLKKLSPQDIPEIIKRRHERCTYREIGEEFGISRQRVFQIVRKGTPLVREGGRRMMG